MSSIALNIIFAVAGFFGLVVGMFSTSIRKRISPPLVLTLAGMLLSPFVWDVVDFLPNVNQHAVMEQITRITLAISLMAIGLQMRKRALERLWKPTLIVLAFMMPLMWGASTLITKLVIGEPWLTALLVGAIITPTDPVVASSIVEGKYATKNIPSRLRHLLQLESGANDGLAFLFVLLPVLLLTQSPAEAWSEWAVKVLLWQVVAAMVISGLLGFAAGRITRYSSRKHLYERDTFMLTGAALALFILGTMKLLNTDAVLGVFAAGIGFNFGMREQERETEDLFESATDTMLTLPAFLLIGVIMPVQSWIDQGWKALVLAVMILLLRRLPLLAFVSAFIEPLKKKRDVLWYGWFGPMGVSAIFYATLAHQELQHDGVWTWVSLVVFASILAHGLTAAVFTKWYGNSAERDQ